MRQGLPRLGDGLDAEAARLAEITTSESVNGETGQVS